MIVVLTEIRLGKLPNDPFDLLGLTREPEPGQKFPKSNVELNILKTEQVTVSPEDGHNIFLISAKILSQDVLVDTLSIVEVVGDAFGGAVFDEAAVNVGLDGLLRVFVKLEDEFFKNVVFDFGVGDDSELIFEVAITLRVLIFINGILFLLGLAMGREVVPVLFEVVGDFFLFLYPLSLCHVAEKGCLFVDFLVLVYQLRLELIALL